MTIKKNNRFVQIMEKAVRTIKRVKSSLRSFQLNFNLWSRADRTLMLRKKQLKFFGHIMRKVSLKNLTLTRHIECERNRERRRTTYLMNLWEWMAERVAEALSKEEKLLKTIRDREIFGDPCPKRTWHIKEKLRLIVIKLKHYLRINVFLFVIPTIHTRPFTQASQIVGSLLPTFANSFFFTCYILLPYQIWQ